MFFVFQGEDGIRVRDVTGVQACALPVSVVVPGGNERQANRHSVVTSEARNVGYGNVKCLAIRRQFS
mgnify:CR=1 FL=1